MSFADAYLEKVSLDPSINNQSPHKDLAIVVAIPACNEPGLIATLESVYNCHQPRDSVELIVALNSSESDTAEVLRQNELTEKEIHAFAASNERKGFRILVLHQSGIPIRHAGAGLARKIAMDHALSRYHLLNRPEGIILSLDADTTCEVNYLVEVEKLFRDHPDTKACSIRFEHPLSGSAYPDSVYQGILQYEIHLRYYIQALRFAGHPHAFHTVGSAFGVRAGVYASQGGMNKRKAGEDFYFLQKIIPLGGFYEVNSTRVVPSPRPSDRVAFGTGPVIRRLQHGENTELDTYHPDAFADLKAYLDPVRSIYTADPQTLREIFNDFPQSVRENLRAEFFSRIGEIRGNSAHEATFINRYYRWFNMFRTLKYLNFAHVRHYSRMPVRKAVTKFLERTDANYRTSDGLTDTLNYLREIQGRTG
jgi:hypothetical protein